MNGNSFGIALILVIFNLFVIFKLSKIEKENKKNISHYETIANEHLKRIYNPIFESIIEIIVLLLAGYFLPIIIFVITYIFWKLLRDIYRCLLLLMSRQEILALKSGLVNMFPCEHNEYSETFKYKIKIEDYYEYENGSSNLSQEYKRIVIKKEKKEIYSYLIDVKDLTKEQIADLKSYHEKRFKDYLRYIPKDIFNKENNRELIENWFLYLDDVRAHY